MATSKRYRRLDAGKVQNLTEIADILRAHSIRMTDACNSGHPTSCCSVAEVMAVLFFNTMRYSVEEPRGIHSDRFVLSKGHAAPILYAAWAEAGLIPKSELLQLRNFESKLEGHPTPSLSFIDVATGSLGQGLGCAAGMAYVGKYFDKASYRVFCLMGDGETAEGSVWEALAFSSNNKLDNLVAIIDCNRLGQSAPTALQHDTETYRKRLEAFGWNVYVVDGHNVQALSKAFHDAASVKAKPSCIVAKTIKGKGCRDIEDKLNWHGKAIGSKAGEFLEKVAERTPPTIPPPLPPTEDASVHEDTEIRLVDPPNYKIGEMIATRVGYGNALVKLGEADSRIIALDGDMMNSTQSERFKNAHPDRFIECYIAEQNMVGVAMGCAARGRCVPFLSTFGVFFSRAFDQIRVAAISKSNIKLCGSHCGFSAAGDGPTQMALEDIAMYRIMPNSTIFYPSDTVAAERAVELAANHKGLCYIRTTKVPMPVIYQSDEEFAIGKAKVVRQSSQDKVTVIGCCATLVEALKAADDLLKSGVHIRVVDPFTIKPLDVDTILTSVQQTAGRIIIVEDHYAQGGLGEAVTTAIEGQGHFTIERLAAQELPHCGEHSVLLEKYGISSTDIKKAVEEMIAF